jgi:hypothetical protein
MDAATGGLKDVFEGDVAEGISKLSGPGIDILLTLITGITSDGRQLPPDFADKLGESAKVFLPHLSLMYGDYKKVKEAQDIGGLGGKSDAWLRMWSAYSRRAKGILGEDIQPFPGYERSVFDFFSRKYVADPKADAYYEGRKIVNEAEELDKYHSGKLRKIQTGAR